MGTEVGAGALVGENRLQSYSGDDFKILYQSILWLTERRPRNLRTLVKDQFFTSITGLDQRQVLVESAAQCSFPSLSRFKPWALVP